MNKEKKMGRENGHQGGALSSSFSSVALSLPLCDPLCGLVLFLCVCVSADVCALSLFVAPLFPTFFLVRLTSGKRGQSVPFACGKEKKIFPHPPDMWWRGAPCTTR